METGIAAAAFAVVIGLMAIVAYVENLKKKARAVKGIYPSSFATRHQQMIAEIQAQKSEVQIYMERIEAAFNEASECGALLVSEVGYDDIESDMYRDRSRNPDAKTMLTRITPIMPQELAGRVRDYEIRVQADDYDSEERASICLAARGIKWLIEEVPAKYEPPKLKDMDRISYPDLSSIYSIPESIREGARKMLGYDSDYVVQQAELLAAKNASFEVTEE